MWYSTIFEHNLDLFIFDPILGGEDNDNENENEDQSGLAVKPHKKVMPPRRYKVLIHNDDYTTMEFVVYILQKFFSKSLDEAEGVMLKVHKDGIGICGVYSFEIAESKVSSVVKEAKAHGHPLKCTFEPE